MSHDTVIEVRDLVTSFADGSCVHNGLDFTVYRNEVIAIVGGSGAGKTTLLREILLLQKVTSGSIQIFGQNILQADGNVLKKLRQRWGMMFQSGALFSGLTVLENVAFPLSEFTHLSKADIHELAYFKLQLAQFPAKSALKYPAELSGGMIKRAAVARALATDPELLFLDEPTAGLDPKTASGLDALVLELKSTLGLTIVMVTHDLDTLWTATDRVAFLGEQKVLANKPMAELVKDSHPLIQDYFANERSKRAKVA
ncbi:MAG: ABC transporter ATP-binding protein [Legionellales bacterium]|nr:ABC transporter ATP-binding protein [Legionellales bacterium]